jgi:hypothetical protein
MARPGEVIIVTDDIQDVVNWSWYYSLNAGAEVLGGTYECPFVEAAEDAPEGAIDVYTFACPVTVPVTAVSGDTVRFHFEPTTTELDEGITDEEGNPVDFYYPATNDDPLDVNTSRGSVNQRMSLSIGIGF